MRSVIGVVGNKDEGRIAAKFLYQYRLTIKARIHDRWLHRDIVYPGPDCTALFTMAMAMAMIPCHRIKSRVDGVDASLLDRMRRDKLYLTPPPPSSPIIWLYLSCSLRPSLAPSATRPSYYSSVYFISGNTRTRSTQGG